MLEEPSHPTGLAEHFEIHSHFPDVPVFGGWVDKETATKARAGGMCAIIPFCLGLASGGHCKEPPWLTGGLTTARMTPWDILNIRGNAGVGANL